MEMQGWMGGLYRISEWIMRFSVTNVLWGLCSLPFVILAMPLLMAENVDQLVATLILLAIISPFVFFPATAAMYSVVRKWVLGDVDVPLFKTFFRGYKDNYKQSMFGGIIYSVLFFLFGMNYYFYIGMENELKFLSIFFLFLFALLFISMFHFFSIISHLHMSTWQMVKNAALITIGRPLTTLLIAVTNGFILYISFFKFQWLVVFFMGSLMAYMAFFYFERMFSKVQEKQQQYQESLEDQDEEFEQNETKD